MLGWLSLGLAEPARLELSGRARLERADQSMQTYNRSGGPALNLNLEAGDRLCIIEGRGRLVYGIKAFELEPGRASCFEVARPKSFWQTLVASCQDIGVCKKQAEAAFVKEAKSRGLENRVPVMYVPASYTLDTLTLAVSNGHNMRLMGENGELLGLEATGNGIFVIPTETLKNTWHLEVQSRSGLVLYAAPVRWVHLATEATATGPLEAALILWLTKDIGYAPAAYSYLLAAGASELFPILEAQIRREFQGSTR